MSDRPGIVTVIAEDVMIGVPLCAMDEPQGTPAQSIVAVVVQTMRLRSARGTTGDTRVTWIYADDRTRTFRLGEKVACWIAGH